MRYLPHTPDEIGAMLRAIGAGSIDELFGSIPPRDRQQQPLELEPALAEGPLMRHLTELAERNQGAKMVSFLGAGNYDHQVAQAVDQLLLRSELYTAYTPYQPEVSQGTLQIIFEFQTIVSEILGLPVANASIYDASTATAEAVLMARRLTRRSRALISGCVHPEYQGTVCTYIHALDAPRLDAGGEPTLVPIPALDDGQSDLASLTAALDADTACVVVGYPGFFGSISDLRSLGEAVHEHGALLITVTSEPFALALLESPGVLGADIAVAEGQGLGLSPSFGGPGVGLFATRADRKFIQQIPGRLVGETVDPQGQRGYVLTLSTREQHIRRERATSNICTNSGLCAAAVTINMSLLGRQGYQEVAEQCLSKAEYLKQQIGALDGYALVNQTPTFNEFVVEVRGGDAAALVAELATQGLIAGFALGRVDPRRASQLLVAVTEKRTRAELDRLVATLAAFGK